MKHLIMGTAGHIDHGKTALIRALTGVETDTHKEEKKRGITINLGFASMDLPSGDSIGIVDVPGHKNFINTMVAGAAGIDFTVMVIAADSGVMPQTREHLQIMQILGIENGIIALTKIDIVDEEIAAMATEEIREFTEGTFLENAPIIPVSAKTGEGLDNLRQAIEKQVTEIPQRKAGEVFRLTIDRIFTVSGFGTVVTGSVLGGRINTGDTVYLLPKGKPLRIRRMERHGKEVSQVFAGDRASMNLVGLDRADFERGMIIADRTLHPTRMLDARLQMFDHDRALGIWGQGDFIVGTFDAQARIHCIETDGLAGGQRGIVQIHLPRACIAMAGDRFVLRSSSSDLTLGGGEIIDPLPLHHRRRPEELVEKLRMIADGTLSDLIAAQVRKRHTAVSHREIATAINASENEVNDAIASGLPSDIVAYGKEHDWYLIPRSENSRIVERVQKDMAFHHRKNPLDPGGRTVEELLGMVGLKNSLAGEPLLRLLLKRLGEEHLIKQVGHTWALIKHEVEITPMMQHAIWFVENFLRASELKAPLINELVDRAAREGLDQHTVYQTLRFLEGSGEVYAVDGTWLHAQIVDPIRLKLLKSLAGTDAGMTVAQFRDLIDGNRKICLLLFGLFDKEGITERRDDVRVITDKGREVLQSL
ncbi:MAG: selenocysteine-specific translation elongation factor [Chitinivibrionales bacterium]